MTTTAASPQSASSPDPASVASTAAPFASPFNPAALFPPFLSAADITAWLTRIGMMPRVLEIAQNAKKGATPYDVVWRDGPVSLRRYRATPTAAASHQTNSPHQISPSRPAAPLLAVFALVNRPYVLDLLPHKSVLRRFLDRGFDVYLIDWGIPDFSDATKTLHDYVQGHLHRAVRHILASTNQPSLSILGYCMGGTLSAIYTSLHQSLVRNLILMAAPIDWSDRSQLLALWTDPRHFDVDGFVDAVKLVPADFLGSTFKLLRPVDNYITKWLTFYEKMTDEAFLEEFFAMETWSNDNIPIAGEAYRDFIKFGVQQNRLVAGSFPLRPSHQTVSLRNITCPVLNLVADADHLVPCGQSLPFDRYISSRDYQVMSVKAGHIGLAVGAKAHKELWPRAAHWLADRSTSVAPTQRGEMKPL